MYIYTYNATFIKKIDGKVLAVIHAYTFFNMRKEFSIHVDEIT